MKISVWITSQQDKKIPKVLRINSHDIIVFGDQNKREITDLWQEFGTDDLNTFYAMYQRATRKRYSFLQIRARFNQDGRYVKNFKLN